MAIVNGPAAIGQNDWPKRWAKTVCQLGLFYALSVFGLANKPRLCCKRAAATRFVIIYLTL
jgi:hypothetical protein